MPRSACSLLGARYIADALPAFKPRVIGTAFAYALTDTAGVSLKGPPHPFPPQTPVLSKARRSSRRARSRACDDNMRSFVPGPFVEGGALRTRSMLSGDTANCPPDAMRT